MENIIGDLRRELLDSIDERTKSNSQRFFKEQVKAYGVKVPTVHKISKIYFRYIESEPKVEIFRLCEILWKSGYLEESLVACNWSYFIRERFVPADFRIFNKWIDKYVHNWASCDTFCNHTIGAFIEMYPENIEELIVLARSNNRWMRRASAVSLILPARKGMFLDEILKIADILLSDKDDMVQKGTGWMLKAASEANQRTIYEYVVRNKDNMPRTTLRYAIEKMSKSMKTEAMKK